MDWIIGAAKAVGKSHLSTGSPCQDAFSYKLSSSGNSFILALSDGAGSSVRSEEGSRLFTESIVKQLSDKLDQITSLSNNDLDKFVIKIIDLVRNELGAKGELSDFHATALIAVGTNKEVRIYHIGDGSALVGARDSKNHIVLHRSEPENGEFANETFFFTLKEWRDKLRVSSIKNPVFCILCSDGVDPFLWDASSGTRLGFVKPVLKKVSEATDSTQVDQLLKEIIEDPRTDSVTTDDKSVVVAVYKKLDVSNIENLTFSDKNQPLVKDYDQIDRDVKNALQDKNNQLVKSSVQVSSQKNIPNQSQSLTPKSKLPFTLFTILLFITIGTTSLLYSYSDELRKLESQHYIYSTLNTFAQKIKTKKNTIEQLFFEETPLPSREERIIIIVEPKPLDEVVEKVASRNEELPQTDPKKKIPASERKLAMPNISQPSGASPLANPETPKREVQND